MADYPPLPERFHLNNSKNIGQIGISVETDSSIQLRWQRRIVSWPVPPEFGDQRGGMGFVNANGATVLRRAHFMFPQPESK